MDNEIIQPPAEVVTEGETNVTSNENVEAQAVEQSPTSYDEAFTMALEKDLNKIQQRNKQIESGVVDTQDGESDDGNKISDDNSKVDSVSEPSGENSDKTREVEQGNVGESFQQFGERATTYIKEQADAEARQEADKVVKEQQLVKLTIDQLQQVKEDEGKVFWINPLDRNNPFTSLTEVRAFVKEWNEEMDARYKSVYDKKYQESLNTWIEKFKPAARLKQFEERYNKMDPIEKKMLLNEVKDYAVLNKNGNVVGFNCDLNAIADRIHANIEFYNKQNKPAEPEKVEQPVVDMPSNLEGQAQQPDSNAKTLPSNVTEAFNNAMMKELNNRKDGGK